MGREEAVVRHYAREGLEAAILQALAAAGVDTDRLTRADLHAVDEFHMGWHAATIALGHALRLAPGMSVLDVGSGLGGPARHFAEAHGCAVTGIDLTPDFVAAATGLTRRAGLADRVRFVEGSALAMPFGNGRFDAASLIHVGMNIPDKSRLFAEIRRVLRPGGRLAIYDLMRTGPGEIAMPMPWASTDEASFVEPPEAYAAALVAAGFRPEPAETRAARVLEQYRAIRARIAAEGAPLVGLQIVIGPDAGERVDRLARHIEAGILAPVEILAEAV
jgi:SAM-dependent methyltransferase